MDLRSLNKLFAPLRARLSNLVARAVIQMVRDDSKIQLLQIGVLADETRDEIERVQEYGFSSVPLRGAEAVVLFIGGHRDHGVVIATDDRRHRPVGLQPGEACVYSAGGGRVLLRADGSIEVEGTVVKLNGGTQPVARAGDTAGPYPIVGGNPTVVA